MKKILTDIQDGSFAKEWLDRVRQAGKPNFKPCTRPTRTTRSRSSARKLRKMFTWMEAKEVPQD